MSGLLKRMLKHADVAAAVAVVVIVLMMIVPLPSPLLDLLIAANLAGALTILITTMYVPKALDFASFPSLLLITTLFRLAINVSVTRLVLLHGDAGSVVHAFGSFVAGGNLVIGLVIFLILVVIQFVVITNGSGRIAEVAARFTLDAMPGKQMAIDADLNAGQITDEEAKQRRKDIAREADFYGAMDGASKFIKVDAVAGIVIVFVNLLAGMAVGILQRHVTFSQAIHTYSVLTIGDGLAAQIPALLISTGTGILVARSASEGDLGSDVMKQVMGLPRAPKFAGALIVLIGLVPGLPKLPLFIIGGTLFMVGRALGSEKKAEAEQKALAEREKARKSLQPQEASAVSVDPLELAIGFGLVPMADAGSGGSLLARVGVIRKQIASQLGLIIAPVRVHDEATLESHQYVIRIRGGEVARGRVVPGHQLAMNPGDVTGDLPGIPTTEPAFGLPATWIEEERRSEAEALGYTVVDSESVIVTHLTESIRRHADELLTRQETKKLLDELKELNAAAVEDVVPEKLGIGAVQRVLQQLLREGVPIRDLGTILETIGDRSTVTRDPYILAEYARAALARTITADLVESETLRAIALEPTLEQEVAESVTQTNEGEILAMDPSRSQALVAALAAQVESVTALGLRPVLICSSRIRRHLRRLVEHSFPHLPVLAYTEIGPGVRVETTGVIAA
ncbi:MAG: flagellar biosynthesis protein FlhA [Actinobacteria bacterium]|nr:flagellar biosynthesis protein FlhA [Actinomycetota bacterium]